MPKTRQQKEQLVSQLTDKLSHSKSVVLANYQGLNMLQLSQLRQKLADDQAELAVTKNNLLKLALGATGYSVDDHSLEGATATLMSFGDEIVAIKSLSKALKDYQIGSIKIGYLDKELLSGDQIEKLAQLPSKDQLRGMLVGALGGPLYGIVGVLQANIRNLVYVLDQIKTTKGGE